MFEHNEPNTIYMHWGELSQNFSLRDKNEIKC